MTKIGACGFRPKKQRRFVLYYLKCTITPVNRSP